MSFAIRALKISEFDDGNGCVFCTQNRVIAFDRDINALNADFLRGRGYLGAESARTRYEGGLSINVIAHRQPNQESDGNESSINLMLLYLETKNFLFLNRFFPC